MSSGAAEFQRGFSGDRLDISDATHAVSSKNFFILHRQANETREGLLVNGNYTEDATERIPPVGLSPSLWAGTPPQISNAGTSVVTTAPAAIIAPRAIL